MRWASVTHTANSRVAIALSVLGVALALSAVGLCLTPFIVLAVLMESGRPILYRQPRLGRGGQPFLMT